MEKLKWCGLLLPLLVVTIFGVAKFELGDKQGAIFCRGDLSPTTLIE